MFKVFLGIKTWSCLFREDGPFFGCCCSLEILSKCGGYEVPDRASENKGVAQMNGDGLGETAKRGCGKELGGPRSAPRGRVPREWRLLGGGTPAGRLLSD